ncbi:metallophosphatase [Candidatus Bipolaricaulota bacterium]|nr:metallophosphatase [Candidatus Bipolaricaulota bacterium]
MIRPTIWTLLWVVLLGTLAVGAPITVLYTNDIHVRLDRLASIGRMIELEREQGNPVLLFDAGDTWQDHRQWIPNVWGAERMIGWMNATGFSSMTLGNHDTYWGPQRLSQLILDADFPVLSANWQPTYGERLVRAATLLRVEDATILVIGLTTPEFLPIPAYPGWRYRDPEAALREQLKAYADSFDWVFVVGHIGLNDARPIAREVPQIDLFVSGHSHEATIQPLVEGHTLIVQSGAFGQALGRLVLDLDLESHTMAVLAHDLIPTERTPVDVRAGVQHLISVLTVIACAILAWIL